MRDPFSWSFPIGRLFGISVRMHFLFPLVALGLILRVTTKDFLPGTWIDMAMILALLFLTVLLHEFGHCFAARQVGGEASEVLLWPLGGLAACDVPHQPRAHFLTAAAGPAVNLLICLGCGLALALVLEPAYRPTWNPLWNPTRVNEGGAIALHRWDGAQVLTDNLAAVVLARLFFVSWVTFLLNVILIGFPWDAGRMFQSALWPHLGYRQATLYAVFAGFICMFVLLVVSIMFNEVLVLFLAFFTYTSCKQEWLTLEAEGEESLFGYDFSQGYTSLERDEPAVPRPRRQKVNFLQRWLQRRAARKLQKQQQDAEADARRVDELLEKIQLRGKDSLTDEEQRFLKRYADRMKNKEEAAVIIMADLIQPRTLKGFRDYPPELMMPREQLLDRARRVYRSYGFAPIDTPALEYAEILLGKGGEESDKQVYRFTDAGGRDVALRFDLTVPFARFAAEHIGRLGTPFKRYHMGPVWRGENIQRGRYREFWQCDFDTIGTTANAADIEVALVIHDLFQALAVGSFTIHVNNRLVLNGLLEELGLAQQTAAVLRGLDKLAKIGKESVARELADKAGLSAAGAERLLNLAEMTGGNDDILERLRAEFGTNAKAAEGINRLDHLLATTRAAGVSADAIKIDLAIARGLDYYTGTVYETFLAGLPGIGSVCSGGRYDNLAGLYTKQPLPGVGASLGLDRLLAALEELKLLESVATPAPVFMVQFSADRLGDYERMARAIRAAGIGVEVYPEPKKVGAQLQFAEKRGFKVALIAGPDEFAQSVWKIKDLARREERTVAEPEVITALRVLLG